MADDTPSEHSRGRKRSHKSPKVRIGKPPLRMRPTPQTSRTSPRRIHRQGRINEALALRCAGKTFDAIAREMKVTISTAHGYVTEGLGSISTENARELMTMELRRLDNLLAVHFPKAIAGDLPSTAMTLRITELRCRLVGLFPQQGTMAQILVQAQSGKMGVPSIEFIVPTGAPGGQRVSPADMASPPAPPFPWQRQLAPPSSDDEPWFRDPLTGAMRQGRTET